jgi:hypothetical protein
MFDIYCMQMGGCTTLPKHTKFTRYNNTHLATIKRIVEKSKTEYVWVVSDLCDYKDFDFTWQPLPWEADQIHCWASNDQQYGDTFLIPVSAFKRQADTLKVLGWYKHINWHNNGVPRTTLGNMYEWVKRTNCKLNYNPSLWEKRDIHVFTQSGSVLLVPRDCKHHFRTQYYDYPYILRHNDYKIKDKALDVVYVSNGEKNADLNWNRLKKLCPRAKRIDGVNGRAQAYKACAEVSETDWFINVFAKCWVHEDFDFNWQPDYLQNNKHYIFNAYNPVTELTYGHMGIIVYHKQMVLDCNSWGLDFTLSMSHTSVPITGSTADYATTPYETWRTAFRECVKLTQQEDIESKFRLKQWLNVGKTEMGKWSIRGANDAISFVNKQSDLQLSFEWAWLEKHFDSLYNL